MEAIACTTYSGIVSLFLFLSWCTLFADAQPGFLSIDCGGEGNRTDPNTNIKWVPDDNYIQNLGKKAESYHKAEYPFYLRSLRVFPKPLNKSCYELPITPNVPHLLRLTFLQPNSTGSRGFNYSVETIDILYTEKVIVDNGQKRISGNNLVSADSVLQICLIRTSECNGIFTECDDPFISSIELRLLKRGMYAMAKPGIMLHSQERCDVGSQDTTRYPQDPFDRLWYSCDSSVTGTKTLKISTSISVDNTINFPPSKVMQTAVVSNTSDMYFYLGQSSAEKALVLLYFAGLNSTGRRSFSVAINNISRAEEIDLGGDFSAVERQFEYNGRTEAIINLQSNIPDLSPIINAFDIYSLFETHPRTSSHDVKALREMGKALSLNNWTSDPCFGFPWERIICTNTDNTMRISQINLSGRQLRGFIPPSFGQLTELVLLSLTDNYFNGTMPNLTNLTKLETLNLQKNSLSDHSNNNSFDGMSPNLTNLYTLQILHLQNNYLSGKIPDWLSKFCDLKVLYVSSILCCILLKNIYIYYVQEFLGKKCVCILNNDLNCSTKSIIMKMKI